MLGLIALLVVIFIVASLKIRNAVAIIVIGLVVLAIFIAVFGFYANDGAVIIQPLLKR